MKTKGELEKAYFSRVPNARKINPVYRAIFEFMYEAHCLSKPGTLLLNVYASHDFSGNREAVYREEFFKESVYHGVDFWKDKFLPEGQTEASLTSTKRHTLPYPDKHFDILVTTKFVLEHVSEPEVVLKEFYRVLKPGGTAFIVMTHLRRQHQNPHDYFRFTEFAADYLLKKVGFAVESIKPTNGYFTVVGMYAYFFQRGLGAPKIIEKTFDLIHYAIIEPVCFFLDRLDNGYGRDLSIYFLARVKK